MTGPFAGVPPIATVLPYEAAESYYPGASPDAFERSGPPLMSIARLGVPCDYRTWSQRVTR